MSDFKRLDIKKKPRLVPIDSNENSFWEKYQSPIIVKENAAVTSIDFSPTEPHDFAVTAGSRVQIYSSATNNVKRTISRFRETASSARYRGDGQLLAAGGDEGIIRVFDVSKNNRFILRQLKGHTKCVKAVQFTVDGHHIVSGSDDTVVRHWDIPTGNSLLELHGHEDYIRCMSVNLASSNLILTGSYDHTVRGWDLRSKESPFQLNHGAPVEALLVFPSGGTCVTAGGNYIKVWDLLCGGRVLTGFSNHQKTITCLAFDGTCKRLLSGGLDRHLKAYSVEDYRVVHSISYPAPILSMGMSPNDSHVTVGMTTRLLSIRHRPHKDTTTLPSLLHPLFGPPPKSKGPRPGSQRYFSRGFKEKPAEDDHVIILRHKPKLENYEKCLKSFKFKAALDAVMSLEISHSRGKATLVYSVLQELARMDRLHSALSGRTDDEIIPIIIYLRKNLLRYNYTPFLLDVCEIIISTYSQSVYISKELQANLKKLKSIISAELKFQKQALQLMGVVDTILTAATVNWNKRGVVSKTIEQDTTIIETM